MWSYNCQIPKVNPAEKIFAPKIFLKTSNAYTEAKH